MSRLPVQPVSARSSRPLARGLEADVFDRLAPGAVSYRDLFRAGDAAKELLAWAENAGVELNGLRQLTRTPGGRSQKVLFGLRDGFAVESVLIRRPDGCTACVSSQVGCAFACRFCASGQAGLKRNLTAGEIVEQVVRLGPGVNRIVFMGIGEPLNNYDEVLAAIRVLRDRRGLNFPTTGITISTIGIPKALARLREEHLGINLTVSLHATTQAVRDRLIPGARKHGLGEVVARAESWATRHNRTVTYVYLLLPGINDTPADARRLCRLLEGRRSRVNLMRWNPVEGIALARTPDRSLRRFRDALGQAGVPVVVRDTQGRDISAACGQLWLRDLKGLPIEARSPSEPAGRPDARARTENRPIRSRRRVRPPGPEGAPRT